VVVEGLVQLVHGEGFVSDSFPTHPPMAFAQSSIVVDESYQLNVRAVGKEYQAVLGSVIRMATAWGEGKGRCQPGRRRGEKLVWNEDDDVTWRRLTVSQWIMASLSSKNGQILTSSPLPMSTLDPGKDHFLWVGHDETYYRSVSMLLRSALLSWKSYLNLRLGSHRFGNTCLLSY
jgi:hypothetical protein